MSLFRIRKKKKEFYTKQTLHGSTELLIYTKIFKNQHKMKKGMKISSTLSRYCFALLPATVMWSKILANPNHNSLL